MILLLFRRVPSLRVPLGYAVPPAAKTPKRETLLLGSRHARSKPKRCKNRHLACFGPETLGPPTRARKRAPATFDDQPKGLGLAPEPESGFRRHDVLLLQDNST